MPVHQTKARYSLVITSEVKSSVGRKEMFYLTMHSTHFIYRYMVSNIYGKEPFR